MCTVTIFTIGNKIVITSNRDEKKIRPVSAIPECWNCEENLLYYVRDLKAGGSWIFTNNKGDAAVLLNGGLENHTSTQNYHHSRGVILKEMFCTGLLEKEFNAEFLEFIEPFQLIVKRQNRLCRYIWDGNKTHFFELDSIQAYIFSSATLYSKEIRKDREKLFQDFVIETHNSISPENIWSFHEDKNKLGRENSLFMNRNEEIGTRSVTQLIIEKEKTIFKHWDVLTNTESQILISNQ